MTDGSQHLPGNGTLSVHSVRPHGGAISNWWEHFKRVVLRWGILVALSGSVAIGACAELHLIPVLTENPAPYVLFLVSLIYVLSERFTELQRETREKLGKLTEDLEVLRENLRTQVYSLDAITQDMNAKLRLVRPGQRVVINHLGLDMKSAWEQAKELIRSLPNLTDIDYRITMLSGDHAKLYKAGPDIRSWMQTAKGQFLAIERDKQTIIDECTRNDRVLHIEVRKYTAMPVVHGIQVLEPIRTAYVAFCRWDGPNHTEYAWGRNRYHRIMGTPSDPAQIDLLDIFDGHFHHFWNMKER